MLMNPPEPARREPNRLTLTLPARSISAIGGVGPMTILTLVRCRERKYRPCHHDPCNPAPCAHLVQQQVAGNLEEKIADKEESGAQPIHSFAKVQIIKHLQFCESNIYSIEIFFVLRERVLVQTGTYRKATPRFTPNPATGNASTCDREAPSQLMMNYEPPRRTRAVGSEDGTRRCLPSVR